MGRVAAGAAIGLAAVVLAVGIGTIAEAEPNPLCRQMANPPSYPVFKSDGLTAIGTFTVQYNGYAVEDGENVEDTC